MMDANIYEVPIVFSNLPLLEELCHLIVSIDPKDKKDSSVKSDFQWQLLKTRILIFSDLNVIASPMVSELSYIHVVCKREFYKSGSLNELLVKNRLQCKAVTKLTKDVYESCLLYNLISRLAPAWNKIEKLFVEGRYFLMQRGELNAVELNCFVSGNFLCLYCCPTRLWLTSFDLLDFDLPISSLEHSVSEKFFKDLSHAPLWVHVLPSFKRGRAVYVTNRIPENCVFSDYQEMRRHWKNTYGFRLPEEGSSMIYVGVNFFGPLDFTYPIVCVRRGMHYNIGHPNLAQNFASAVNSRASVICGTSLSYVNLGLFHLQSHFLLENEPKWNENNILNIEKRVLENFLCDYQSKSEPNDESQVSLYTQPEVTSTNIIAYNQNDNSCEDWFVKCSSFIDGLSQLGPQRSRIKTIGKPIFDKHPRRFFSESLKKPIFLNDLSSSQIVEKTETQNDSVDMENSIIRAVDNSDLKNVAPHKPVFTSEKRQSPILVISEKSNQAEPTLKSLYKPVFTAEKKLSPSPTVFEQNQQPYKPVFTIKKQPTPIPAGSKKIDQADSLLKPLFKCYQKLSSSPATTEKINETDTSLNPLHKPAFKPKIKTTIFFNNNLPETDKSINLIQNDVLNCEASGVPVSNHTLKPNFNHSRISLPAMGSQTLSSGNYPAPNSSSNGEVQKTKISKRASTGSTETATRPKKPAVIIGDNEIEELARGGKLNKANIVSLRTYLRKNGVQCKNSDKKTDLLIKAEQLFQLPMFKT